MDETPDRTRDFEAHRSHLRSVAYRMLGSVAEAEDAVQEAWIRYDRADTSDVDNLGGWLTTVTARVCLNKLRSRRTRPEEPLEVHVPDPVVTADHVVDPEQEAVLADSVGMAMLIVLDTLPPAERLAFVLHDMFAMPFDDIAAILDRSTEAARQLASRGRRRVQGATTTPDSDPARRREVVQAFFAAAREGDFDGLIAVLAPDVVLRADGGARSSFLVEGAEQVAGRALTFSRLHPYARPATVNGGPGVVVVRDGERLSVMAFTVAGDRIVEMDVLLDHDRLAGLDLSAVDV